MSKAVRFLLVLLCSFIALVIGFLAGFYFSFLLGANIHDALPGVSGLFLGLLAVGATIYFMTRRERS